MTSALSLNVIDTGSGPPVIFQHGLGGDNGQIADSFPPHLACHRITVECRGHGATGPDPSRNYAIATFAEDILGVADRLGLERFGLGGISMGAAIALHIACQHPDRVSALAVVRPAWLTDRAPANMQPFVAVAHHLKIHGAAGRGTFAGSPIGLYLAQHAPDNLASLLGFFAAPDTTALADLLLAIALDGPGVSDADLAGLTMPVLTVGHGVDVVHPLDYAKTLAAQIPGARFAEITPKAVNRQAYRSELHGVLAAFFQLHLKDIRS